MIWLLKNKKLQNEILKNSSILTSQFNIHDQNDSAYWPVTLFGHIISKDTQKGILQHPADRWFSYLTKLCHCSKKGLWCNNKHR